jgi:nucleotide-binding universal stress UspA family protein
MAGEIVVGYDGTEGAQAALAEAIALARDVGAGLVVVFGYGVPIPERESADYRETLHELGEKQTQAALERAAAAGVTAQAEVVFERPVDALVRVADERDARTIVVGSYGERPLKAVLLGSTPHKLLHLADRPVLVVPAHAQ